MASLVVAAADRPSPPTANMGLQSFPPEILLNIFERLIGRLDCQWDLMSGSHVDDYRDCIALSAACRQFYHVVTPLIYGRLRIFVEPGKSWAAMSPAAVRHLHRSLKENPSLRPMCQTVEFRVGRHETTTMLAGELVEMAVWLTGTRRLTIRGLDADVDPGWLILRAAVSSMPHLRHLFLLCIEKETSYHYAGFPILPVCDALSNFPYLESLFLHGVREDNGSTDMDSDNDSLDDFNDGGFSLEKIKQGSCVIKELRLSGWQDNSENLERFMAWSPRVEQFILHPLPTMVLGLWDFAAIALVLQPQKDNLRMVAIEGLAHGESFENLDLAGFSRLEELRIPYWDTDFALDQQWRLLAPALRKFVWLYPGTKDYRVGFLDFMDLDANWIRGLASTAAARESPLEVIELKYRPMPPWIGILKADAYPWDLMKRVAVDVQKAGIQLIWDAPTISRKRFQALRDKNRSF